SMSRSVNNHRATIHSFEDDPLLSSTARPREGGRGGGPMPELAERALHTRVARSVEAIRRSFADNQFYVAGRTLNNASTLDHYTALAYTIRDRMLARMVASYELHKRKGAKTVAYLSAEFLLGPHLANNILNLKLADNVREALSALGLDLDV